jgi:catechol 2,3-dioxygenase-like lactoylglutathione lyase family enzyme
MNDASQTEFHKVIPILRMFSIEKTKAFYIDFLGFTVDWEHRFEKDAPLYMQISRAGCMLHLSEHHGDGTPGAAVYVVTKGLDDFHRDVTAKTYHFMNPGIERMPWGARCMTVIDPSGNRLSFNEHDEADGDATA